MRLLLLLSVMFLALVACAPDRGDAPALRVPAGTPLEVEEAPYLAVGEGEGDPAQEFDRVVTPFLLPDGRVVVPLAGFNEIRVFGPDGAVLAGLGGRGEGPGEFSSLGSAWARGDTVEAFDPSLRRITRFPPGREPEVVTLEGGMAGPPQAVLGWAPDGWVAVGIARAPMEGRQEEVVHRFGPDGAYLGRIAGVEGFVRHAFPGGSGPEPLSPRALFAVERGRVYVAETLTPRIRVLDPVEGAGPEIAWNPARTLSPGDAFRAVVDSAAARAGPDRAAEVRQRLEAASVPERISAFWGFLVDEEGFVWVRPYDPLEHAVALGASPFGGPGPGGEWLILSPEGEEVGRVELPEAFEPVRITSDAVVGIHRDAFDVESVRVHSLRRF